MVHGYALRTAARHPPTNPMTAPTAPTHSHPSHPRLPPPNPLRRHPFFASAIRSGGPTKGDIQLFTCKKDTLLSQLLHKVGCGGVVCWCVGGGWGACRDAEVWARSTLSARPSLSGP